MRTPLLCLVFALPGCSSLPAADTVAIDLTSAICTPLENQPLGQPWVDFVCEIAAGVEVALEQDGGAPTSLPAVRHVHVRVPLAEASTFMAGHRGH